MYVGEKASRALWQWAGPRESQGRLSCCPREMKAQQGQPGSVLAGPQHTHFEGGAQAGHHCAAVLCLAAVAHSLTAAVCSHLCGITLIVGPDK